MIDAAIVLDSIILSIVDIVRQAIAELYFSLLYRAACVIAKVAS